MATIDVHVSPEEHAFFSKIAQQEGLSLSELIRTKTMAVLEDTNDAKIGDAAFDEFLRTPNARTLPLRQVLADFGIKKDAN